MSDQLFTYVSTRAGVDPVRTIIVCVPARDARTLAGVEAFVRASGWLDEAEADGAVIMAPVAPEGWDSCPKDLPLSLYLERRGSFEAPSGQGFPGSPGRLWAWETLIDLVGYGEGATFAADFLCAHPGFAAAAAFVGGSATEAGLAALDDPSTHWLVPEPADYAAKNSEVPVAVWFFGDHDATALRRRLILSTGACDHRTIEICGRTTSVFENPYNPACQVRVTPGIRTADPEATHAIMERLFCHVVRWKSGPDGQLASHRSRRNFFEGAAYLHGSVRHGQYDYHHALYLPSGMSVEDAAGLPLVVSLHGRGEPTWLFSQKNGWEDLADQTHGFAVLLPDSPGNLWVLERDGEALVRIIEEVVERYALDASRVYLTGFSNGAIFTLQLATTRPRLFAAASPWNSPGERACREGGHGPYVICPGFAEAGARMPLWVAFGEADEKAPVMGEAELALLVRGNGCDPQEPTVSLGADAYPCRRGYQEGSRMTTTSFADAGGQTYVSLTTVRDLPHGAITDEARAAWEFMRRFRREPGADDVEVIA